MGVQPYEHDDGCLLRAAGDELSGYLYATYEWYSVYLHHFGWDWCYTLWVGDDDRSEHRERVAGIWANGFHLLGASALETFSFARRPGDCHARIVRLEFLDHTHSED